jgi:hypothetical protein
MTVRFLSFALVLAVCAALVALAAGSQPTTAARQSPPPVSPPAPQQTILGWLQTSTADFAGGSFQQTEAADDSVRLVETSPGRYATSGEYVSIVFDAGEVVQWGDENGSIRYRKRETGLLPRTDNELVLEMRTGNTPDPDGSWSAWTVLPLLGCDGGGAGGGGVPDPPAPTPTPDPTYDDSWGCGLSVDDLPNSRYIQYRVLFTTAQPTTRLALEEIEVHYQPIQQPGTVDMGFRPNPDGYRFENYGGITYADYTIEDMRRSFGDAAVCQSVSGDVCTPKATAQKWNMQANQAMNGGHCDGMASTSLRFFIQQDTPANFQSGAVRTHDLLQASARRNIAYYFVRQLTDPVSAYKYQIKQKTPAEILDLLRAALSTGASDPVTLFVRPPIGGGHAVTPYAITDQGNGLYQVRVYDNNWPNDATRAVSINTTNNTWSYDLGWTTWSGNANTHTLGIVPISQYAAAPVCPWCAGNQLQDTPFEQIWSTGQGRLLVSNAQGQRLGYVGDEFINEIAGAYETVVDGGLPDHVAPIYNLPPTDTYTMTVSGQAQAAPIDVARFGPGYAVLVEDMRLASGETDELTIDGQNHWLRYQPDGAQQVALTLALDETDQSNLFQIGSIEVAAGEAVEMQVYSDTLTVQNTQRSSTSYDLLIKRTDTAGQHTFAHNDLSLLAGEAHLLAYTEWDGSADGAMPLRIDQNIDGTGDQVVTLDNQITRVYLPLIQR